MNFRLLRTGLRKLFGFLPRERRFALYRAHVDCDPAPSERLQLKIAETQEELEACRGLLQSLCHRYHESPQDAEALLKVGDAPLDPSIEQAELAAWSQLATTVLASDVAILLY